MGKERYDVFEEMRREQRAEAWGMLALVALFTLPIAAGFVFGVAGVVAVFALFFVFLVIVGLTG